MLIQSGDGYFGVTLTPVMTRTFFVFTLRFGDRVFGDGQPAVEYTSVAALAGLRPMTDPRIDPDRHSPQTVFDFLSSDAWVEIEDEPILYDLTLPSWGEGMDAYTSRAYLWGEDAIFLFREHDPVGDVELFRVDRFELAAIAAAAMAAHTAMDAGR